MSIEAWVMLVWLHGQAGFLQGPIFSSQTGCHIATLQVAALDPRIEKVQCVPWDDPPPGNIG